MLILELIWGMQVRGSVLCACLWHSPVLSSARGARGPEHVAHVGSVPAVYLGARGVLRHNQELSLLILLFTLSQETDTPWILVLPLVFSSCRERLSWGFVNTVAVLDLGALLIFAFFPQGSLS